MLIRVLRILALALLLRQPAGASEPVPAVQSSDIRFERSGDEFTIDVHMRVAVPVAVAWAVLVDFEGMPNFIPNLTESRVVERIGTTVRVSQKGTTRVGPFVFELDSTRDVQLTPYREIRAVGIRGNFKHVESSMRLEARDEGTLLTYHVKAVPDFWVPPLIGPTVIRQQTAEQLSSLLAEMRRRHPLADSQR